MKSVKLSEVITDKYYVCYTKNYNCPKQVIIAKFRTTFRDDQIDVTYYAFTGIYSYALSDDRDFFYDGEGFYIDFTEDYLKTEDTFYELTDEDILYTIVPLLDRKL